MFTVKHIFLLVLGAILLLLVSYSTTNAQSTAGASGLLNSPSADMAEDGTIKIGANVLNKMLMPDNTWDYNTINYYLNITFLPFFEASITNTVFDLWNEGRFSNVDRAINVKFRPIKEGKYWPSVAIGSNDFLTTSSLVAAGSGNKYFGKAYLALSKHFNINGHVIGLHTAYNQLVSDYLTIAFPISGGISYSPAFYRGLNVIAEYDTNNFNIGANIVILRYFYIQVLLQSFKYPSIGAQFQFTI